MHGQQLKIDYRAVMLYFLKKIKNKKLIFLYFSSNLLIIIIFNFTLQIKSMVFFQ